MYVVVIYVSTNGYLCICVICICICVYRYLQFLFPCLCVSQNLWCLKDACANFVSKGSGNTKDFLQTPCCTGGGGVGEVTVVPDWGRRWGQGWRHANNLLSRTTDADHSSKLGCYLHIICVFERPKRSCIILGHWSCFSRRCRNWSVRQSFRNDFPMFWCLTTELPPDWNGRANIYTYSWTSNFFFFVFQYMNMYIYIYMYIGMSS